MVEGSTKRVASSRESGVRVQRARRRQPNGSRKHGKCVGGLPYHGLEKMLHRYGVGISRESMCLWMQQGAKRPLPLVGLLREELLRGQVSQADETTVQGIGGCRLCPSSQKRTLLLEE